MYTQEDLNSYVESRLQSPLGSNLWGPAVGVGLPVTAFALGFARTKSGGRVWDVYFKALQHMEGALPMGIGATFRLSEMVSPFASPREFTLSPATHPELFGLVRKNGRVSQAASAFEDYISRTTGISIHRLKSQGAFEKGFTWTRRGTFLGDLSITGGPVLSTNVAALSTGPRRTGHMFEWFGRVSGVSNAGFLKGIAETEDYLRPTLMPAAAGGSKWSLFGKGLYSVFSAGVGRMNLLLSSPSELPLVQDIAKSIPLLGKIDLGVKPGPGMEMLSRYAGKAAIGLGIYHGIRYADYLGREYGPAASIPIGAATGGLAGAWLGWKAGKGTRYGLIGAALGGVAGGLLGGPISGAAEVYSQADILRAQVSDVTGLGGGARRTEDFFPGMTEPTTLIGAAGVGLLLGGVSDYYQRLAVTRAIGKKRGSLWGGPAHQRVKDIYEAAEGQIADAAEKQYKSFGELAEKTSGLSKYFTRIRQRFAGYMAEGKFKPSLRAGKGALLGAAAFTGLSIAGSLLSGDIGGAGLTTASAVGAAALYPKTGITGVALALAAPFFLRGKTPSEQLERQYSGEEEVPIKAGRLWEMGRSGFSGRRPYYRPSRIAMMKKGGIQETALYGSEENFWATDPILHPLRFLTDPYAREKLMWQQGYRFPMSKTPFEDFPILGPVLAASFGQIIKPAKFIGREEWLNDPEVEGGIPDGWDSKPLPEPISRTGIKGTIGEQAYRMTELMGLVGFMAQSIKGGLTGNESWFPEDQWATPSIVSGTEPAWWSLELGGAAMSSELLRRFVPHRRNELQYRNPLPSGLPSWLPGPDSMYFLDFSRADVYSKIKEPWARLPGAGYSAIHPELKGVAPEEYPDYWRFKILCLHPLTRVYTSTGVKEIRTIEPGEFVYGQDGELKEVIARETKVPDGQAYSIRTYYNNDCPLICSPEHRILVADKSGEISEKRASELTKEHYLLFPKRKSPDGQPSFCIGDYCDVGDVDLKYEDGEYWAHVKGSQRYMKFNLPASYEAGRALGLYLAEGCASLASQQVVWCFHQDEAETLAKEVKVFIEACGLRWYERYMPESLAYQVTTNNKLLARFLIQTFGHGAGSKHIGLDLARFPSEFSLGIIDGYFDGDGNLASLETSISLRATSISKELLEQGRLALSLLGITAALRKRKGNYRSGGFATQGSVIHDAWTLDIKRSDIQRLPAYREADLSSHKYKADPDSRKFGFELENYVAFRIKEVAVVAPPDEWVDIAIDDPSGSNCFLTTAGLVHNSDVAPWSREYGQYDKMMSRMWADNRLTAKQILDIQTTRRQVDETKKAKEFEQYRYDNQATEQKTVRITGEVAPGYFTTDTFGSAPISLAGLDISTPALANIAMRENASLTAKEAMSVGVRKRASMARYLREQLRPGAEVQVQINRDRSALMQRGPGDQPVVPAVISVGGQSLNRQLVEMGLAEERGGAQILDPMAATGVVQRAVGSFWENLMHGAETPLESFVPLAPIAKFVHQRTPLEEYQRSEVYGRDVALWQKPISHFLAPGLSTTAWWGGWRGVPQDVQEKYMVEEYFDRLEYMKWKRLESAARMAGEGRAAATYAGRASRTATGVDPTSTKSAYLSLAKYERMYFEEFVRSPTGAERREISKIVSPQFNRVLHAQWAKREAEQAQMRTEAGVPRVEDPSLMANFEAMRSPQTAQQREQQIAQQEAEMPVPGPTWVGWNAGTDMEDYKIKTVDAEGMDLARYGIWGSDLQKIQRKPWVEPISSGFAGDNRTVLSPAGIRRRFRSRTNTLGSGGPNLIPLSDETVRMEIESPGRDRLDRYMRDPSILTF